LQLLNTGFAVPDPTALSLLQVFQNSILLISTKILTMHLYNVIIIIIIIIIIELSACLKNWNNIMHVQRNFCWKVTLVLVYIDGINFLGARPTDRGRRTVCGNVTSQECKARSSG